MDDFLASPIGILAITVAQTLALLVPVLLGVAYLTLAERKVLAAMQMRRGPNIVGPFGLLQPFADAIKMLMKETIIPSGASRFLFILAPMLLFTLAIYALPTFAGFIAGLAAFQAGPMSSVRSLSDCWLAARPWRLASWRSPARARR